MHKVSIIIPSYNQAGYVAQAIESVIAQSYEEWELVVVDDGSTDATAQVVSQFKEPRVCYIYQANKGLPGARNRGIRHSSGDYVAFLDADDYYHPHKLALQVAHLDHNPNIGLNYSSRISIDQVGQPLRLVRAPAHASLKSFVQGFPFTINDLLIRRKWLDQIEGFDESFVLHSEDRDFYLRLALAGCEFARVDRALAYRRVHTSRSFNNLTQKLETMFRALDTLFCDPRCPPQVMPLRDRARGRDFMVWAYQAAFQGEGALARSYFDQACSLRPDLLENNGQALTDFLIQAAIADGGEHQSGLERVFAHLPTALATLMPKYEQAVARGYLMRGARDILWGRLAAGKANFAHAQTMSASIDDPFLRYWTEQILNFEAEFGRLASRKVLDDLSPHLATSGGRITARKLRAYCLINQAMSSYHAGDSTDAANTVLQAITHDPRLLMNRGALAILARTLIKRR